MTAKIESLMTGRDNIEILRDEVASILALEIANQKLLAVAEGLDPDDYSFDVYSERSAPWELIESPDGEVLRQTPLVNVYLESCTFDGSMQTTVDTMAYNDVILIDCLSAKTQRLRGTVREAADERSSRDVQRIARLVRRIIMSPLHYKLNMPEVLNSRHIQSIQMFQPNIGDHPAQSCVGARISLNVSINENSPQYEGEMLELIQGRIERGEDGVLYANVTFDVREET